MYFFYYYPVGVDVPRPRLPVVTVLLAVVMTTVFVFSVPLASTNRIPWFEYMYRPAELSPLTPLTACFLHGSWMHLLGNLLYLVVFAPALERALGRFGLLLVFCGAGYLGNLTQGAMTVHLAPQNAWGGVVGASGAVSGLLGLFLLRYPYARIKLAYWAFLPLQGINRTGTTTLPVAVGLLLWLLLQVVFGIVEGSGGSTAYGAHLGGLVVGAILAVALGLPRRASMERLRVHADRHRRKGNYHAAVGLLDRYLERVPYDEEAWLDLARAQRILGDHGRAMQIYRERLPSMVDAGRIDDSCEVYLEARRGNPVFHLDTARQRKLAFWLEKRGRFGEAITAYLDHARFHADDVQSLHALARAATLMVTRLHDVDGGRELLDRAIRDFPEHPMRSWLRQERRRLGRAGTSPLMGQGAPG